jgi:hypothetical protein
MIHIVFNEADIEILKKAQELDETMGGEVIIIRDDYAVGPIVNLFETEGYQHRRDWWKSLIEISPYDTEQLMHLVDDRMTVHKLKRTLEDNDKEEIWIWMGQNQHDVCGYYWLVSQFGEYQGRIHVLYLNNLPFINERGQIFYPSWLHEIQPKEFLKAKKLCRKITLSEFEVDPDEWKRLSNENAFVRILEGGKKIAGKEESFYDKDILAGLTKEWIKGNKAIHNILGKMKIKTGDVFLLWRMKEMAAQHQIEINGDTAKGWKDFELRLKSSVTETLTEASDAP